MNKCFNYAESKIGNIYCSIEKWVLSFFFSTGLHVVINYILNYAANRKPKQVLSFHMNYISTTEILIKFWITRSDLNLKLLKRNVMAMMNSE